MTEQDRRAHPRQDIETPAELTVEQQAEQAAAEDQRAHERLNIDYEINLEAGLNIGGQEVMRLTLVGRTIDISRGGMLIGVDQDVIPGARCEVRFPAADGRIEPEHTTGKVRRSSPMSKGFQLAVQFDEPLSVLQDDE